MDRGHCRLCGSSDLRPLFQSTDHQYKVRGTFGVAECGRCRLISLHPMATSEQIRAYYATEDLYPYQRARPNLFGRMKTRLLAFSAAVHFTPGPGFWHGLGRIVLRPATRRLLPRAPFGGTLLDVGCGNGAYLLRQRAAGWRVFGCELSPSGVDAARAHHLEVFHGTLTEARYPGQCFDVVRLEQVFEHVDDPRPLLEEIRRILKPSGLLVIGVPNAASLSFRLFGPDWGLLGLPFHVHQYAPSTIGRLLTGHRFEIEEIRFRALPICWLWSLNNLLNRRFADGQPTAMVNNVLVRIAATVTFVPLIRFLLMARPAWAETMQVLCHPVEMVDRDDR